MKLLPKTVFFIYALMLLWLVLFKTSVDILSVLMDYQAKTLNLIPFTGHFSEMIENFIVFIPFGLLLSSGFKRAMLWQKVIIIFVFSLAIETIQYVLAIGVSDITDVITNTLGGLFGLGIYAIFESHASSKKMDRIIALIIMVLIIFSLFLRFFMFKVKY